MTYLKNGDPRICPNCKEVWCWKVDTKIQHKRILKKHRLLDFPRLKLFEEVCEDCKNI